MSHGQVLKSDNASADAYVYKDITASWGDDLWIEFFFLMPTVCFTALSGNTWTGDLWEWSNATNNARDELYLHHVSGVWYFNSDNGEATFGPIPDTWHFFKYHLRYDGGLDDYFMEAFVDGVSLTGEYQTFFIGTDITAPRMRLGCKWSNNVTDEIFYFDSFKAGTSEGASDKFGDDFESGGVTNWTSSTGSVSVVTDPFPDILDSGTITGKTSVRTGEIYNGITEDADTVSLVTTPSASEIYKQPTFDATTIKSVTAPSSDEYFVVPAGDWGPYDTEDGLF